MANTWTAEDWTGEIVEEFRSTDFDPVELWEQYGHRGTVYVYDQTDGYRPVARIETRTNEQGHPAAWLQPLDENHQPSKFEWQ